MTFYVVTLEGISPPERADATPFTKVRIEESAACTGPWAVLGTQTVNTGDPDSPASVDVTVSNATILEGFYRVIWVDAAGGESTPSEAMQNLSQTSGGTRPTVREVASLVRARTKIRGGTEVGTFNDVTRPTDDEVDSLLDDAADEVLGKVKAPAEGTPYEKRVRGLIALYGAMLVELSFFPEQVGTTKSPYDAYAALYDKRLKALIAEGETGEPQGEGGSSDTPGDAAWTFPDGELLGYSTRW